MTAEPVPLSDLAALPEPVGGWSVELERRGIPIMPDDVGRPSITRDAARALFAEHRENEVRAARKREELEQRAVEAYQRFRASLPRGVSADEVPAGMTAAAWLMASELVPAGRVSVVEDALAAGGTVFRPVIRDEQAGQ